MTRLRQTILRPVGLVTQPNAFGWYVDGALKRAINCVMRNPGELDAAPSMWFGTNCGGTNNVVHKVMPLDVGHNYTFAVSAAHVWDIRETNNSLTVPSFVSLTNLFSETGRISPARSKERMLVNSANGILVCDYMTPSTSAERALRLAGLPQLTWRGATSAVSASPNGAIPAGPAGQALVFGYQAIHTRAFADGYKIVSVPTPIGKRVGQSVGFDITVSITVGWPAADVAVVGDVIELYRTDGLLVQNTAASIFNAEPPTTYKLVASRTLTATDITNGFYTFVDNSRMGDGPYYQTGGRELYSNPGNGQGGATAINRQPPIAACTAVFDGRTFYGNTTDRPKMLVTVPAGIGTTSGGTVTNTAYWRTNGIGERQVTGVTFTNGSAVVSGVSASDIVGIVPGMSIVGVGWPLSTRVVSVGATTVTMSAAYTGVTSGGNVANFDDVLYIGFNNTLTMSPYRFADLGDLLAGFGSGAIFGSPANQFEVTASIAAFVANVGATPSLGQYNPSVTFSVEPKNHGSGYVSMQVMATHGANYSPPLAEYTAAPTTGTVTQFARTVQKNRLTWSKDQQPEHVNPGDNESFVGSREIIAMASTSDAMWLACLDGIFRMTGAGGQYRFDPVDSTAIICAPQCMTTLNEDVYMYSNFGMLMLNSERRENLTDMVIGDLLPGPQYAEVATMQLVANETDLELVYLDAASKDRLWIYATKEGGGWTTLENNTKPGPLTNITALAFQRSPSFAGPALLVGVSPLGGSFPTLAAWGNTASYLTMDIAFQPVYADDPMSLKQWIEASFLFDTASAGKSLRPVWNSTPVGSANVVLYQNAAYARAGIPRQHAIAQSISAGCDSVSGAAPQARFQGISLMFKPLTQQAKQRK